METDHKCLISYSKDGGRNWSNWRELDLGAIGNYEKRLRSSRFGRARRWVFRIRVSSSRKHDLFGAVAVMEVSS